MHQNGRVERFRHPKIFQNLLAKVKDKRDLRCGPGSADILLRKKIADLDPALLCPPESTGDHREAFLQSLCVLLAALILAVLAKLAYDYWAYRTKGQLPWLVLKMP